MQVVKYCVAAMMLFGWQHAVGAPVDGQKEAQEKFNKKILDVLNVGHFTSEDRQELQNALDTGANINFKSNKTGKTFLHVAAEKGNKKIVEFLLTNGAKVSERDNDERMPLELAAFGEYKEIVEILIKNKADVNDNNSKGITPLMIAIVDKNEKIVKLLLECGADPNTMVDESRWTCLHLSTHVGDEALVRLLLCQQGIKINVRSDDGKTPLYVAVEQGHSNIVQLLLTDKRVDVNQGDGNGLTPLHIAVAKGDKDAIVHLLQKKARVNEQDNDGLTPLHLAAQMNNEFIVQLLLDNDADVALKNNKKNTAADLTTDKVIKARLEKIIKILSSPDESSGSVQKNFNQKIEELINSSKGLQESNKSELEQCIKNKGNVNKKYRKKDGTLLHLVALRGR